MLFNLTTKTIDFSTVDVAIVEFDQCPLMSINKELSVSGDFVISIDAPVLFFHRSEVVYNNDEEAAKDDLLEKAHEEFTSLFGNRYKIIERIIDVKKGQYENFVSGYFKVQTLIGTSNRIRLSIQEHQLLKLKEVDGKFPVNSLTHKDLHAFIMPYCEIDQELLTDFAIFSVLSEFFKPTQEILKIHESDFRTRNANLRDCFKFPMNLLMIDSTLQNFNIKFSQVNINSYVKR